MPNSDHHQRRAPATKAWYFNIQYLVSARGLMKCFQLLFSLIAVICAGANIYCSHSFDVADTAGHTALTREERDALPIDNSTFTEIQNQSLSEINNNSSNIDSVLINNSTTKILDNTISVPNPQTVLNSSLVNTNAGATGTAEASPSSNSSSESGAGTGSASQSRPTSTLAEHPTTLVPPTQSNHTDNPPLPFHNNSTNQSESTISETSHVTKVVPLSNQSVTIPAIHSEDITTHPENENITSHPNASIEEHMEKKYGYISYAAAGAQGQGFVQFVGSICIIGTLVLLIVHVMHLVEASEFIGRLLNWTLFEFGFTCAAVVLYFIAFIVEAWYSAGWHASHGLDCNTVVYKASATFAAFTWITYVVDLAFQVMRVE